MKISQCSGGTNCRIFIADEQAKQESNMKFVISRFCLLLKSPIPLKYRLTFNRLHGIISQKKGILVHYSLSALYQLRHTSFLKHYKTCIPF